VGAGEVDCGPQAPLLDRICVTVFLYSMYLWIDSYFPLS
jgi:hypothetical protein